MKKEITWQELWEMCCDYQPPKKKINLSNKDNSFNWELEIKEFNKNKNLK
jgi:hypothetical protein